ncbi:MAG TPA: hypothetical protein DCE41_11550 [Cytophagales bacterium]|nr:hypothetical protein [Cytophagales bacterium]HAA22328.1 hypothetical protein [Cytophagales bacterium]HAP60462.1 hypothetical protein [Cytophagales bacterium]
MTDWKTKLERLDTEKIKDVFFKYEAYGYPKKVSSIALEILKARGENTEVLLIRQFYNQEDKLEGLIKRVRVSSKLLWGGYGALLLLIGVFAPLIAQSEDSPFTILPFVILNLLYLSYTLINIRSPLVWLARHQEDEKWWMATASFVGLGALFYPLVFIWMAQHIDRWETDILAKREQAILEMQEQMPWWK